MGKFHFMPMSVAILIWQLYNQNLGWIDRYSCIFPPTPATLNEALCLCKEYVVRPPCYLRGMVEVFNLFPSSDSFYQFETPFLQYLGISISFPIPSQWLHPWWLRMPFPKSNRKGRETLFNFFPSLPNSLTRSFLGEEKQKVCELHTNPNLSLTSQPGNLITGLF